ncbi:MAG: hypothetical protein C4558_08930 [Dehalococcoidia bacterium]|nr:MAG: hypothetical protein C4558_08930 [Dehalococcoidia bacterium]
MTASPGRHRVASAQDLLPLDEIVGDVIRLRGGECRAVLQAGCVNFALKSESEQEAILAGYRRFLNGLSFPLQILARVVPTDVDAYLAGIAGNAAERGDALSRLARDHEAFVRRIARERTLLDRRFYVVIPAGAREAQRGRPAWPWRRSATRERERLDLLAAGRQLTFRCAEVGQGLTAFGVSTRRLDEGELAALWRTALAGTAIRQRTEPPRGRPVIVGTRRPEVTHG